MGGIIISNGGHIDKLIGDAIYTGFEGADGNVLRSGEALDVPFIPSLVINRDTLVNYNKGLQLFYMREWRLARVFFEKALGNAPDDYLSRLYLERTYEFEKVPSGADWDGVVTLVEKQLIILHISSYTASSF
ncbi:MAG: hypothetical protein LBB81_05450 [Treponema sp.]|jgi:hypothetical protein|nr:hypothetical protein [Treponema sp.]